MKLSIRTRYGTRAMLDLALNYNDGVVSAREIGARQQVSRKYLEHPLVSLRSAGLIRTVRGVPGGHRLARHPTQMKLREIYSIFEARKGLVECVTGSEACDRRDTCVTQEVCAEMHRACMDILESTTLEDLARRVHSKQAASSMA
ncbi:MAG: Rrf2 family transcriptional regulator [Anaerolineae bacterium]|nr:Rrf2 family transcriptional regulator [Anaerolineae bacterium]NIN94563.1 Rrf2 family transcriptional regulator [Anaerolineae bacterium]NIQ77624.1 Rrf2 family transcriptional regulator [Anaerolineae bacterium]